MTIRRLWGKIGPCRLLVVLALMAISVSCRKEMAEAKKYHCPMHPTVISDRPGDCPICGMNLVPMEKKGAAAEKAAGAIPPSELRPTSAAKGRYYCPMHPHFTSDDPDVRCPECGMKLDPVAEKPVPGLAQVQISPESRSRIGLKTEAAGTRVFQKEIRTTARLAADETRLARVTTKVDGWVEKLYINTTGQQVHRGEALLSLYSPELVATQQELLTALALSRRLAESPVPGVSQGGREIIEAARRRLGLWDISADQIDRIENTGEVQKQLLIYAPAEGLVLEKMVLPGQKIAAGESLLLIADLGELWALADLYENDLAWIRVGMPAELSFATWPGKKFRASVSFLEPAVNPQTRTLKARLQVPNPEKLLRLEMFAEARLWMDAGRRTAVPEDAVLLTGERTYVFLEEAEGRIFPREIVTGMRSGGFLEVVSGLQPGEKVVTSAHFLIDSESALKAALEAVSSR